MSDATGLAYQTIQEHSSKTSLTFVSDWASPFAQRTWIALEQRGIPYTYKEATKAQKSLDGTNYLPNELLPYLELPDGRLLRGSIPCIEYLEEAYGSSELGDCKGKGKDRASTSALEQNGVDGHEPSNLLSKDLIDRGRERAWTDWIRRRLIPTFMRALRARQEDRHEVLSLDLGRLLDVFADEVRGPFFSGEHPTLPDIVLAPFILRVRMKISNRSFHAPSHADASAGAKYQTYAKHLLALESVKRTSPDIEESLHCPSPPLRVISSTAPKLPPELISLILSFTNDYELACTVGLPNALPQTAPWQEQSTPLDRAILSGQLSRVQHAYNGRPAHRTFSKWGARCMIRFGYIHLLDWLYRVEPRQMHELCDELLPEVASAWGRVEVLEWAYRGSDFGLPDVVSPRAMDDASRNGHVEVLQWWLNSGINPLSYSEDALNHATIKQQIATLEWWKSSGLPLKIGNVLDFASMIKKPNDPSNPTELLDWWNSKSDLKGLYTKLALYHLSCIGNIPFLNWWKDSKLPLLYDKEVLVGATKQGKIESLEWWLRSKLPVSYTFFDIEEAIEDCVADREAVEAWWCKHGLRKYANAQNWTKSRALGRY